jgi:XTP/dITP diphosphohydrolase
VRPPTRLVVATKNPDKLREVLAVLSAAVPAIEIVADLDWPDVEETGDTLEANALLKARAVVAATGLPAVADDTGLEVDALGGAPGVHTARFAGPEGRYDANRRALLDALGDRPERSARFRTVVALVESDGSAISVEGVLEGRITSEERGDRGFGYDSVFEVDGRTLAEMSEGEKNRISHRAQALRALAERLGSPAGADPAAD